MNKCKMACKNTSQSGCMTENDNLLPVMEFYHNVMENYRVKCMIGAELQRRYTRVKKYINALTNAKRCV